MSSLNDILSKLPGLPRTSVAVAPVVEEMRPVRGKSRTLLRLIENLPPLRSGVGSSLALSFIVCGWFYGAVVSGSAPGFVSGTAATFGLKATDIVITGQVETSEQDVFHALSLGSQSSLFGFDAEGARKRVMDLPWVKNVAVRKLYPGKLTVAIAEKRAVAVWQHQERLTVVEKTGAPIAKFGISDLLNNRFSHLPHLVGDGAAEAASEILPLVEQHPVIAGRVASYVRVAKRRWDIELSNGVRVKLPESGLKKSLEHVAELAIEDRIFEREITVVDMRLSDRVVVRLDEAAAQTRAELVSARHKAMKKADRKL